MTTVNRRTFLESLAAGSVAAGADAREASAAPDVQRPNIVFIFSDDHAQAAISAYGSRLKDTAPTPNIDRIAREGAIYERSYCANSICGPSRACILTGKHSHKNGFTDNEACVFDGDQVTFPKLLQKAGYQTALVGKWHLVSQPRGFDYWEILPGQGNYIHPEFIQMDGSTRRVEGYCTDLVTDKSLAWLKGSRDRNRPFLLLCQHKAPHRNWIPAERHYDLFKDVAIPEPETLFDTYEGRSSAVARQKMSIARDFNWGHDMLLHGKPADPRFSGSMDNREYQRMTPEQKAAFDKAYGPENEKLLADLASGRMSDDDVTRWKYQRYMKNYLRCVKAVDENVGRLLDYLDESGLADNTVVIYSADQGFYLGEHGWFDKRWIFEESLSMPFLIRWPGVIPKGVRSRALIQNIDYAPTFLQMAGAAVPEDMQGHSLLPVLKNRGRAPAGWRTGIYYAYYGENTHAVPMHDGVRTDRYKIFFLPNSNEWQLFDMEKDPKEQKSVHADPAYAAILADMKQRYHALRRQYDVNNSVIPTQRMVEEWWRARWQQKLKETRAGRDCPLIFLGDSITQGWEENGKAVWEKHFAPVQALNLGFSGDRTEHLLWRIKYGGLDALHPRAAIMLIGTNNTGHLQRPAEETAAGIRAVIGEFQKQLPRTPLVLLAIFPRGEHPDDPLRRRNDEINDRIRLLADGARVIWMDLCEGFLRPDKTLSREIMPDYLHLSPAGYELWSRGLEPLWKRLGLDVATR